MKTVLSAIALALVSSVAAATPTVTTQTADFEWVVTGDGPEMRYLNNLTRTRAEVVAERDAAPRATSYVDGSEYEVAQTMFMSRLTRERVRADAVAATRMLGRTNALLAAQGGGR
jgi:hypothetical protein